MRSCACHNSKASHHADASCPRVLCRRNEWRASRGLEKQRSVAEILAERRAARQERMSGGAGGPLAGSSLAGSSSTPPSKLLLPIPRPPPVDVPLEPFSADRALEMGGGGGGAVERAATLTGVDSSRDAGGTNGVVEWSEPAGLDDSRANGKGARAARKKGSWPWRTR